MNTKSRTAAWMNAERPKSFHDTGRLTKTSGQYTPGHEVIARGGGGGNIRSAILSRRWGQNRSHFTNKRGPASLLLVAKSSICAAVARSGMHQNCGSGL